MLLFLIFSDPKLFERLVINCRAEHAEMNKDEKTRKFWKF